MPLTQFQRDSYIRSLQAKGYVVSSPDPKRKSFGEDYQPRRQQNVLLREGGQELHPNNWKRLADRTQPWPEHLNPKRSLHVMSQYLAGLIELQQEANQNNFF